MAAIQSLHHDTALSVNPVTLSALLKLVPVRQVVHGTDFPFAPEPAIAVGLQTLGQIGFPADDLQSIERGNARILLGEG